MKLNKEEMLETIAEVSSYSKKTLTNLYCHLDEDEIEGENEDYKVSTAEFRGAEGDGADMFLTVEVYNKHNGEIQYIEFSGRYSSWDSSEYYRSYLVNPVQEMVTFYREIKN